MNCLLLCPREEEAGSSAVTASVKGGVGGAGVALP